MKLPSLLTQFLYQNKRLNLPGIGRFTLDPASVIPDQPNKDPHSLGIEFVNGSVGEPDDDLIEYICAHTGKMKSLAVADLDSFLTLGTELVNIGKPFYLEGIGTLTKNKLGKFDFIPTEYSSPALDESSGSRHDKKREKKKAEHRDPGQEYEPQNNKNRRIVLMAAILIGLCIIVGGGYYLYKKNEPPAAENNTVPFVKDTSLVKADSAKIIADLKSDSAASARQTQLSSAAQNGDSFRYKFILLETYNKARALKRYNQLNSYDLKVNMDTKDSSFFKLYFSFPALAKDTVHIKDSLKREYAHEIIIEKMARP